MPLRLNNGRLFPGKRDRPTPGASGKVGLPAHNESGRVYARSGRTLDSWKRLACGTFARRKQPSRGDTMRQARCAWLALLVCILAISSYPALAQVVTATVPAGN